MLCDQSPDPALNCNIRPLSMPDRKFSLDKGGGYSTAHFATQESRFGKSYLIPSRSRSHTDLTIQIDDAGVGDLLHGVVVGASRKASGQIHSDIIPVSSLQSLSFAQ